MIPRGVTLKVPGLYLVKDTGDNASGGYLKNFRLEWGDALIRMSMEQRRRNGISRTVTPSLRDTRGHLTHVRGAT